MGYEVSFASGLSQVPTRIRLRLNDRLEEVAAAIATIPADSVIMKSVLEGALVIEISDWRFEYRIDPERSRNRGHRRHRSRAHAAGDGPGSLTHLALPRNRAHHPPTGRALRRASG